MQLFDPRQTTKTSGLVPELGIAHANENTQSQQVASGQSNGVTAVSLNVQCTTDKQQSTDNFKTASRMMKTMKTTQKTALHLLRCQDC